MFTQQLLQSLVLSSLDSMTGSRCCSYLRQSLHHDVASTECRQRLQRSRLQKTLQAARQTELYRQQLIGPTTTEASLEQVKPITKSDIRRYYPTGVFSRQPASDWRYLSTSGTTDRLSVVADFIKRDHRRSSELRGLSIAAGAAIGMETVEIPPNVCNVVCGITDTAPTTLPRFLWQSIRDRSLFQEKGLIDLRGRVERDVLLRKHTLAPIEPAPATPFLQMLDHRLQMIQHLNPLILRGYPHYLLWLADRARQKQIKFPRLSHVLPYGGLASPHMISRIETGLQSSFRNVYGTSELGLIAASCGKSAGMHLFDDLFLVQLEKIRPGDSWGSLIITDLINTAMPLVRYQVGDVGRLQADPCPCGRKTPRLEVLGRMQEGLTLDDRFIPSIMVADTFFADEGIANGQLEEVAPGCYEAAIMGMPEGPAPSLSLWEERFRTLLKTNIKRIKARLVPYLRPETSGKYLINRPYRSN